MQVQYYTGDRYNIYTGCRYDIFMMKEAKLMARAVARQDVKSAKKAKMSVDDLQGMRSGMQILLPSLGPPTTAGAGFG